MLGMQELVDVADVEVIGTNRLRLPFADATVGQVDFGEWPLPVLISRSFAAGDTFITSTPNSPEASSSACAVPLAARRLHDRASMRLALLLVVGSREVLVAGGRLDRTGWRWSR